MDTERSTSIEHCLSEMQQEVAAMRRRCRWSTGAGLAAAAIALIVILTQVGGQAVQTGVVEEVRAHRFVVVDGQGKVHAEFALTDNGAKILLRDGLGRARAKLATNNTKAGLFLYGDEKSKLRAELGASETERGLWLYDELGTRRAALSMEEELVYLDVQGTIPATRLAAPSLVLYNESRMRVWSAP